MVAHVDTTVLDNGLLAGLKSLADKIYICSTEPTNFTEATSTYALGNKNFGSAGAALTGPAAGDVNGRKVTSVAITDGVVNGTGTVGFWAWTDTANSLLKAVGSLAATQGVTSGNTFSLPAHKVEIPDR
jgi:hypothetical protein